MADYPFDAGAMLHRVVFYLPSTIALFGIFLLWGRSRARGRSWRLLFEGLNIAAFATLFLALWFLCGISSLAIDEVRPVVAPLVLGGTVAALLSYVVYFRKLGRSPAAPPPSDRSTTESPGSRSA